VDEDTWIPRERLNALVQYWDERLSCDCHAKCAICASYRMAVLALDAEGCSVGIHQSDDDAQTGFKGSSQHVLDGPTVAAR
jgi:hypothetical protein